MKKLLVILIFMVVSVFAQAQETQVSDVSSNKGLAAIGAGIAVFGAGVGIGLIGFSALSAIARQPESVGEIRSNMIIVAALIEGVAFFALVVCLLVILI